MLDRLLYLVRDLSMYDERLDQGHQDHECSEYCVPAALRAFVLYLVSIAYVNDCQSCKDDNTHGIGKDLTGDQQDVLCIELLLREEDDQAYPYQHDSADRHQDPLHV